MRSERPQQPQQYDTQVLGAGSCGCTHAHVRGLPDGDGIALDGIALDLLLRLLRVVSVEAADEREKGAEVREWRCQLCQRTYK